MVLSISDIKKSPEYAEIRREAYEKAVKQATLRTFCFFDKLALIVISFKLAGIIDWGWWLVSIPIVLYVLGEILVFIAAVKLAEITEFMEIKMAAEKISNGDNDMEKLISRLTRTNDSVSNTVKGK